MQHLELALPAGNFRAYLFDMDGTVADSMPVHYVAWTTAITEAGGTFPEDLFWVWGGIPPKRIVAMLNEQFGYTMSPDDVVHRKENLYFTYLPQVQAIPSVLEHIHAQHGKLAFAIVSGSPRESVLKTLDTLGLRDLFPVVVAAEDYTHGKPDPEPFLTAARLLGIAPADCLVFEDAKAGIASAQAAGMAWVRVPQL